MRSDGARLLERDFPAALLKAQLKAQLERVGVLALPAQPERWRHGQHEAGQVARLDVHIGIGVEIGPNLQSEDRTRHKATPII